jgi:hypothetical protein
MFFHSKNILLHIFGDVKKENFDRKSCIRRAGVESRYARGSPTKAGPQ